MTALATQISALLPQIILAYSPKIHFTKLSLPIMSQRGWSKDAQSFNEQVQVCIDKRFGDCAFKSDEYLLGFHLVKPMFGYAKESCDRAANELANELEDQLALLEDEVKAILYLLETKDDSDLTNRLNELKQSIQNIRKNYLEYLDPLHICKVPEFHQATELILFKRMIWILRKNVEFNLKKGLDPSQLQLGTQQLVHFALSTLHHAVQDFKHLEGPLSENGVNSLEHLFTHTCSDLDPPPDMLEKSRLRTEALMNRFKIALIKAFGKELGVRLLAELKHFKFPQGKNARDMMPPLSVIRKLLPQFPGDSPEF